MAFGSLQESERLVLFVDPVMVLTINFIKFVKKKNVVDLLNVLL